MTHQNPTEIQWQTPIPLSIDTHDEQSPYPVDVLPPLIKDPILAYQQYGQQPTPLIACGALANISLSCQTLANVARDHLLVSPVSLYFLVAAHSGERKSASDKAFGASVRQWQMKMREKLMPEVENSAVLYQAWRSERDGMIKQLRQASTAEAAYSLKEQLLELQNSEPKISLLPELFFEDVTQEGLTHSLSKGWPSSSLWSDEGGIILSGAGMQTNATKFIATLNRLWDGNPFISHRKSSSSFVVNHRRFSMSMMIQPLLLKQLLKRKEGIARHSGFLARSLMTQPISSMGNRYYQSPPNAVTGLEAFNQRITECLDSTLDLTHLGCHDISTLNFSIPAKTRWIKFFNEIESGMNKASHWQAMQDFASKAAENVARLSALFHLFLGKQGDIETESVEQAIDIVFWHLLETKRIFEIPAHHEETDVHKILKWLKEKNITETSSRHLQQYGRFRDKIKRNKAIETLIEHHYFMAIKKDDKLVLMVNPKLIKK